MHFEANLPFVPVYPALGHGAVSVQLNFVQLVELNKTMDFMKTFRVFQPVLDSWATGWE